MVHAGKGGHSISDEAEALSRLILNEIPKDKLSTTGVRRPITSTLRFNDTAEERDYLTNLAWDYNKPRLSIGNALLAHGTDHSSQFC